MALAGAETATDRGDFGKVLGQPERSDSRQATTHDTT